MKTLGIYYATACYRDEQGRYYTSNGLGRYLQVLDERFPQVQVHLLAPTTREPLAHLRFPLPERVQVYELPYFETFIGAVKVRQPLRRRLREFVKERPADIVWLRYPGAYAPVLWRECTRRRIPCFFEIVGEPVMLLRRSPTRNPVSKWLSVMVASVHQWELRRIVRVCPAFANSMAIAKPFAPIVKRIIHPSTLADEDFCLRKDTCVVEPLKVLFVGALRHEKSLDTLIEAVASLQAKGMCVHLHVVGDGELRTDWEGLANRMLQPDTYRFYGFQTDPRVLHAYYCQADVFVLPSVSEGLPRVVVEAMARSVPVVATSVGGIPDIIRHGETGLLVPPRDVRALAQAIERIIREPELRRRLIANGYALARQHTTEVFLRRVFEFVREETGVDLLT
ncbi:MAG: glycosyltransferase [Armatimonadota bacterium]|nr:glycosyltransferase [Armatimonadota bacterium]